jgi:hypothetical protein
MVFLEDQHGPQPNRGRATSTNIDTELFHCYYQRGWVFGIESEECSSVCQLMSHVQGLRRRLTLCPCREGYEHSRGVWKQAFRARRTRLVQHEPVLLVSRCQAIIHCWRVHTHWFTRSCSMISLTTALLMITRAASPIQLYEISQCAILLLDERRTC